MRDRRWDDDLLALIRASGHLCLQVDDPGWEDARGYLFNESTMTLYFPVAKKYLTPPLSQYEVLIWSRPQVLVSRRVAGCHIRRGHCHSVSARTRRWSGREQGALHAARPANTEGPENAAQAHHPRNSTGRSARRRVASRAPVQECPPTSTR